VATREAPIGLKSENVFAAGQLGFSIIKTYPDLDDAQLEALGIDDDAYGEFVGSQQRKSALHMMGGTPTSSKIRWKRSVNWYRTASISAM